MAKDDHLILIILRCIRDKGKAKGFPGVPDLNPRYATDDTAYHVGLCEQAGFLETDKADTMDGVNYLRLRLTWDGHKYLEANRDG